MLLPLAIFFLVLILLSLLSLALLLLWISLFRAQSTTSRSSLQRSAAVVVLGDVGRSPRMCYHVESLANEGWKVGIVGYAGVALPPQLQRATIKQHALSTPPKWIAKLPRAAFVVVAPFKVIWQTFGLFWALSTRVNPAPEVILVQTPPALPTLFVVRFVALLLRSRVIIDWHNLGYTILALRLSPKSSLVKLAAWLEKWTGRHAFGHLFVTKAMMDHLSIKWKLQGHKRVLHDRPPEHFRRATAEESHELFCGLVGRLNAPMAGALKGQEGEKVGKLGAKSNVHERNVSWRAGSMEDIWPPFSMPDSTPFTERVYQDDQEARERGDWIGQRLAVLRRRGSGVSIEIDEEDRQAGQKTSTDTQNSSGQQLSPLSSSPPSKGRGPLTIRTQNPVSRITARDNDAAWSSSSGRSSPSPILMPTSERRRVLSGDDLLPGLMGYSLREDRPALAVSSTSWTADEDFNMLLLAASLYERRARDLNARASKTPLGTQDRDAEDLVRQSSHISSSSWDSHHAQQGPLASPWVPSHDIGAGSADGASKSRNELGRSRRPLSSGSPNAVPASSPNASSGSSPSTRTADQSHTLPKLLIVVTGKGELRAHFEQLIDKMEREMEWKWVRIRTAWLEVEEYPVLLGSADIGISLHSSSSGLDLPMKVVDMLGCSLPVLALDFPCLDELIIDGRNGLTFSDAAGLERCLETVLGDFPNADNWLRRNVEEDTAFPNADDAIPALADKALLKTPTGSPHPESEGRDGLSAPVSPYNHSFTLLASPMLPDFRQKADTFRSSTEESGTRKRKHDTWRGNWKRVVRPLLLYDEEDEASRTHSRRAAMSAPVRSFLFSRKRSRLRNGDGMAKARTSEDSARAPIVEKQLSRHAASMSESDAVGATRYSLVTGNDKEDSGHLRRRKKSHGSGAFMSELTLSRNASHDEQSEDLPIKEGARGPLPQIAVSDHGS